MNKISNRVKKVILFAVAGFTMFVLSAHPSAASTWKSPNAPYTADLKAGDCTLVTTIAEKNSTHVYTLNPDNTIAINQSYHDRWDRNARCDEIQFHVDHSTSISVLNNWLDNVAYGWYANIGNSHFKGQTISTSRHEWFFVDVNGIHRIPDILTGWSWGLLTADRISIPNAHTDAFYQLVSIGAPLNFGSGQYSNKINSIWKNEDRNFTTLPVILATEINSYAYGYPKIFSSCPTSCESDTDRNCGSLLDWRWFLTNPGYQNCPLWDATHDDLPNWRNNINVWQWEG